MTAAAPPVGPLAGDRPPLPLRFSAPTPVTAAAPPVGPLAGECHPLPGAGDPAVPPVGPVAGERHGSEEQDQGPGDESIYEQYSRVNSFFCPSGKRQTHSLFAAGYKFSLNKTRETDDGTIGYF